MEGRGGKWGRGREMKGETGEVRERVSRHVRIRLTNLLSSL